MSELFELDQRDCQALLARNRVGRLAMIDSDGGPYVVPVGFVFVAGELYGHTAPGKKLSLLREAPIVALLVDEIKDFSRWKSVLVRGRWRELTIRREQSRARALLLNASGGLWWVTAGHGHRTALADATFYRIEIDSITGRSQNA